MYVCIYANIQHVTCLALKIKIVISVLAGGKPPAEMITIFAIIILRASYATYIYIYIYI